MTDSSFHPDHLVSCQVLAWAFSVCEKNDIDIDSILRDIPYSREHLETPSNFIDWPSLVKLVNGTCANFTDDQIHALTLDSFDHPVFLMYKLIGKLRFDLIQQYLYILGPKSTLVQFYPIDSEVLDCDTFQRQLVVKLTIRPGLEPCPNLFRIFAGQAAGLSKAMGYVPAEVQTEYADNGATLTITLPQEKGFIPTIRNFIWYPLDALRASRILRRTHDALVDRNRELELETRQLKEAQHELLMQQKQLNLLNKNIPVVLWTLDLELNPLYFSPSAEQMFGRPMEELLRTPTLSMIHPEDRDMITKVLADELNSPTDTDYRTLRIRHLHGSGSWFWSEIHVSFLYDEADEIIGVVGSSLDVDAKVDSEREQQILREQLADARQKELIGQMAGGIAHDFNNTLQSIIGFTELSLREEEQKERKEFLTEVIRSASASSDLIKQLLAMSRTQPINQAVIHVQSWVIGLRTMLRSLLGENIVLDLEIDPDLYIEGDKNQLERVMMNIAVNAKDAMPNGGTFTITAEHANGKARINCKDSGTGIDEDVLSHVFEPFFTTKPRDKGTGLGLSVIAGIIDQHGGKIEIDSESGQGTTVRIELIASVAPATSEETTEGELTTATGQLILVVDDQEDVRTITTAFLEHAGFRTQVATNGVEAIERVYSTPGIDLVLMDIVMPEMNGDAAAAKIRECQPDIPIVFMSGYNPDSEKIAIFGDSVDWLSKPFHRERLLESVLQSLKAASVT